MKHRIEPSSLTRRGAVYSVLIALAALVLAALPAGNVAQNRPSDLEQKRERWKQMSEEERTLLRERFEQWKRMTPERRKELSERARNLELLERGLYQTPPPKLKEKLKGRTREECRGEMHRYMRDHSSDLGRHMRDKMPPELLERLEQASPEERWKMLHDHVRNRPDDPERRKKHSRFLDRLAQELDLSEEEKERILALPHDRQREAMLDLHYRVILARVEEHGLPEGISAEDWERWVKLPPRELMVRLRAIPDLPEHMRGFFGGRRGPGGFGRGRGDVRRGSGDGRGGRGDGRGERGDDRRRGERSGSDGETPPSDRGGPPRRTGNGSESGRRGDGRL